MNRIIIIGTGNIGKRHLQAISNLHAEHEVLCYDIFLQSLDSIAPFCEKNNILIKKLACTADFSNVLDHVDSTTVIIVATTAKGRKDILEKIIKRKPLAIIAEKPVCQTIDEYESLLELNKEHAVPIYVNFSRHVCPDYQAIYNKMIGKEQIYFSANFSNIGFGCNGIHLLELATWLLSANDYEIITSKVTSIYKSKRKGFHDFSGKLTLKINGVHSCTITIMDGKTVDFIEVVCEDTLYKIFETVNKKIVVEAGSGLIVQNFRLEFCSEITGKVVSDIVHGRVPKLPQIKDTYLAHKILFDFMKRHDIEGMNIT